MVFTIMQTGMKGGKGEEKEKEASIELQILFIYLQESLTSCLKVVMAACCYGYGPRNYDGNVDT